MKILITALMMSLTFLSHANVSSEIVNDLEDTINTELLESNGKISSLKCINHFVGILCYSTLEFTSRKESPYTCEETYYYLGFGQKVYERLCSNCWFSEGEEIFNPSCK